MTVAQRDVMVRVFDGEQSSGLHSYPSALIVQLAARFASDVFLAANGVEVSAKSLMGVMMLNARRGTVVSVRASGTDAAEAVEDIAVLLSCSDKASMELRSNELRRKRQSPSGEAGQ